MSRIPFSFPIRVYWEDTDAGGVVYHGSYVRFLERARTEWLRARGTGQQALKTDDDVVLAIRHMTLEFLAPAHLDDELQVDVVMTERRAASLRMAQAISRGDRVLVAADVRVACLTASTFRPRPLPEWLAAVSR